MEAFKQKTHIGQSFSPFELYIKFLIEYFGKNIDYDPDTVGDLPKTFKKLSYQVDAVNQGFTMLLNIFLNALSILSLLLFSLCNCV